MRRVFAKLVIMLFIFQVIPTAALAVPNLISYQGTLSDDSGTPVSSMVSMVFNLYDVETGGTSLWNETQSVEVSNGVFNVKLGSVNPLTSNIFEQDALYLGIQVSSDTEMIPRQQITSAAYAHKTELVSHTAIPIGTIMAWVKNVSGVPALSDVWVECNGQVLADPSSPLNGQPIPNLNNENRFLRGNTTSGATGGQETINLSHKHSLPTRSVGGGTGDGAAAGSTGNNLGVTDIRPPYFDVVWIMKIK